MKSIIIMVGSLALLLGSGCVLAPTTVTEYDSNGKIVRVTKTPIPATLSDNLKDKTVVWASNGWGLRLSVSAATSSDLMPGFDLEAGNIHHVVATIPTSAANLDKVADVVSASEMNLTISPSAGVTSSAAAR